MLKPKFKVGQKVWFIAAYNTENVAVGETFNESQLVIKSDEVTGIWIDAQAIGYELKTINGNKLVAEQILFATKKEAKETMESGKGFALAVSDFEEK